MVNEGGLMNINKQFFIMFCDFIIDVAVPYGLIFALVYFLYLFATKQIPDSALNMNPLLMFVPVLLLIIVRIGLFWWDKREKKEV